MPKIRPETLEALIDRIRNNDPTLIELNLSCAEISDKETQAIAEALKRNNTLMLIDLSWNQISDIGAAAIAEALKENKTIADCHIDSNKISAGLQIDILSYTNRNQNLALQNLDSDSQQSYKDAAQTFENREDSQLPYDTNEQLITRIIVLEEKQEQLLEQQKLLLKQQEELQVKANSFGKMPAENEEEKAELLQQQQQEITHQLAEINAAIADLRGLAESSAKRLGNFDLSKLPSWISDLNLSEEQIVALNKIEGFRLEELNDVSVKETYDELQKLAEILEQQKAQQEEAKKRILDSRDNFFLVNDAINKPFLEQMELEENSALKKAAVAIQSKFNAHFFVSVALEGGKLKSSQGKITSALGYASVLVGELPFGGFISNAASSVSGFLGEKRRGTRYERLGDLIETKDLSAGSVLAEKIGRKIALTGQVKILEGLGKLKNEKEAEKYYKKLAESCLEAVKDGSVEKILEKEFGNTQPTENDLIKAIGVSIDLIHPNHPLYEISQENAQKIAASAKKEIPQTVDVNQLFALVIQMQQRIESLENENLEMKKRITEREQTTPITSPNTKVAEPLSKEKQLSSSK